MRHAALALLLAAAPLFARDAPLERRPAARSGGFHDDKIHYFEQPDFVLASVEVRI